MSLQQGLPLNLMQTSWAQQINPLIDNPIIKGVAITNISLIASTPLTIPTTLSRVQQGWFIIDNTASCNIWRTQPFNSQNLTLESSANTTISIWMF